MPSESMIGGYTVMIGGQVAPNNGELHRHKRMNTIAYGPAQLLV